MIEDRNQLVAVAVLDHWRAVAGYGAVTSYGSLIRPRPRPAPPTPRRRKRRSAAATTQTAAADSNVTCGSGQKGLKGTKGSERGVLEGCLLERGRFECDEARHDTGTTPTASHGHDKGRVYTGGAVSLRHDTGRLLKAAAGRLVSQAGSPHTDRLVTDNLSQDRRPMLAGHRVLSQQVIGC